MTHATVDMLTSGIIGGVMFWSGWLMRGWIERARHLESSLHRHTCRDCGQHFG